MCRGQTMKKVLIYSLLAFSFHTYANDISDSGFDIYIGSSIWYTDANGGIEAPSIDYTLELKEENINKTYNGIYFFTFEHPLRYLPDIRLTQNNVDHKGKGSLVFITTFPIEGAIDLSHSDITFYYNVLDGMGFIDIGATARIFDGELYLKILPSGTGSTSDLSTTLGLFFLHTGINLPLSGLSMGLSLNAGDNGNDRSADGMFYMQYEIPQGLGVTGGYRYMNTDIASKGSIGPINIDINASFNIYGPSVSLYYHF